MSAAPVLQTPQLMHIADGEFERIRRFVHEKFGIALTDEKRTLVVGRLQPLLRAKGFPTFTDYMNAVETDRSGKAISELIARISTNHTHFYREHEHFDFFQECALALILEDMRAAGDTDLRLWCAACSSGEEAYTLQMLVMEHLGADYPRWNAGLLATDISPRALEAARRGIYAAEAVEALPAHLRRKFFTKAGPGKLAVTDAVRQQIVFRRFNLMRPCFPFSKPFHIIFCRNVMIYFDFPTRSALVRKLCDFLVPGGWLFVGHSESLHGIAAPLDYVQPAVYRRRMR